MSQEPKWVHVHEFFVRWGEFWGVERCLGEVSRKEAEMFYDSAIEDDTGRTTFFWYDDSADDCWIGVGQAVC
jgi:hypothetical protein